MANSDLSFDRVCRSWSQPHRSFACLLLSVRRHLPTGAHLQSAREPVSCWPSLAGRPLPVQHLMNGVFSSASDHVDETVPCPTALMLHHELLMRPARPALACAGAPSPRAGSGMLASCVAADFGRCGHLTIHLSGLRPAPPGRVLAASPSPSPSEQSIAFGFNWPGEPRPLLRPRVPPQCQPCEHESESLR